MLFTKSGLLYKETPDGVVSPFGSAVKSAAYIIFNDTTDSSNSYKALNGTTGAIDYKGSEPAAVIYSAINNLPNGGKVFIKAGTYLLASLNLNAGGPAAIGSTTVSGIELCGEGAATHLQAAANLNGHVIALANVNNWHIHDLQIDGNRANQSGSGATGAEMIGIEAYGGITNLIIRDCYIHDCKTYGIQVYGTTIQIRGNYCLNCNANGIIVSGGSQYVIDGNVVNGASDAGISIGGVSTQNLVDCICVHNIVQNVNLGVSPFGANAGVGIYVGDNYPANRVTVKGNIIDATVSPGLYATSCTDITFEGNHLYSTGGVYIGSTTGGLKGNTIDEATPATYGNAIEITGACPDLMVEGNYVVNIPTSYTGVIVQTGSNPVNIRGNTIVLPSGSASGYGGIYINGSNNHIITGNTIDMSAVSGGSSCYGINAAGANLLIASNVMIGLGWYASGSYNYWQAMALGQVTNSVISNNTLIGMGTNPIPYVAGFGTGNHISGNYAPGSSSGSLPLGIAINPFGKFPNPFNNTNATVGVSGNTGSPSANATYTAQGPDMLITSTGGIGVSITIRDPYGNTVLSGASTLTAQRLPFGYTINFGPFTTAPTVTVFGE